MSVGRVPPTPPQLPAFTPQPTSDARAAQRAFFAAALGQAQAQPQPPQQLQPAKAPPAPEPDGYLRPGSIIDIKV